MKAVIVYQLAEGDKDYFKDLSDLPQWFEEKRFKPCQKLDYRSIGFCDTPNGELVTTLMGVTHFSVMIEDKILPPAVIRQCVEDKCQELCETEARRIPRKERQSIKDQIVFELLPKAFTQRKVLHGFFAGEKLFIGAGSAKQAEEICSLIREATQKLPVKPVQGIELTPIVKGEVDTDIQPLDKIKLTGTKDTRVTTHKDISTDSDEVFNAIMSGMIVESMDINFKDTIKASVNRQKHLKSIRFSDELMDEAADAHPETAAEEWQATIILQAKAIIDFFESNND